MAEKKKLLTWKQKLEQGLPLTTLEETKADADWNYRKRLRDEAERKEFEEAKNRGRAAAEEADDSTDEDQKGNKK